MNKILSLLIILVLGAFLAIHCDDDDDDQDVSNLSWNWANPLPQGNDLHNAWASPTGNYYVAGNAGTVLRYDGVDWQFMDTGTRHDLYGIWGTSDTDIYAAGDWGTIIHFDGENWITMDTGVTHRFSSISGNSTDNVFACANYGLIMHYDGNQWSSVYDNPPHDFSDVFCLPTGEVTAVGTGHSGSIWGSKIVHYSDGIWTEFFEPGIGLYGVWGTRKNNIIIVGTIPEIGINFGGGGVYRFNGTNLDLIYEQRAIVKLGTSFSSCLVRIVGRGAC